MSTGRRVHRCCIRVRHWWLAPNRNQQPMTEDDLWHWSIK